ncbi:MAG TPA: DUF6335 family protein [Nitrospira sp.]|nr:DUF6335 family protein [Nitrospira sp.]
MTEKKCEDVRDADDVIREYYQDNPDAPFREDDTEPVSSVKEKHQYTSRSPEVSGGDVDAAWEQADVGPETVGGSNPTPDQDIVEDVGRAAGVTYEDGEPLKFGDKVPQRDERRWELDPASSEDYQARASENAPPSSPSEQPRTKSGQVGKARSRKTRPRRPSG